jgi:hypothetical protein
MFTEKGISVESLRKYNRLPSVYLVKYLQSKNLTNDFQTPYLLMKKIKEKKTKIMR